MTVIEARGLGKVYAGKAAVDDLSFEVRPGSVTGFLGPNGAGKSTTMRLMLGLHHVRRRAVHVAGPADDARRRPARGEALPPDPQGTQPPADARRRQRDRDVAGRRGARAARADVGGAQEAPHVLARHGPAPRSR